MRVILAKPPVSNAAARLYLSSNLFGRSGVESRVPRILSALHLYLPFSDVVLRIVVKGLGSSVLFPRSPAIVRVPHGLLATSKRKPTKVRRPEGLKTSLGHKESDSEGMVHEAEQPPVEGGSKEDTGSPELEKEKENLLFANQSLAEGTGTLDLGRGPEYRRAGRSEASEKITPMSVSAPYTFLPLAGRGTSVIEDLLKSALTHAEIKDKRVALFNVKASTSYSFPLLIEVARAGSAASSLFNRVRSNEARVGILKTQVVTRSEISSKYTSENALQTHTDFEFPQDLDSRQHTFSFDNELPSPLLGHSFDLATSLETSEGKDRGIRAIPSSRPTNDISSESGGFSSDGQLPRIAPTHNSLSDVITTPHRSFLSMLLQSAYDVQTILANITVYQTVTALSGNKLRASPAYSGRRALSLAKGDLANQSAEVLRRDLSGRNDYVLDESRDLTTSITREFIDRNNEVGTGEWLSHAAHGNTSFRSDYRHPDDNRSEKRRDSVPSSTGLNLTPGPRNVFGNIINSQSNVGYLTSNPNLVSQIAKAQVTGAMLVQAATSSIPSWNRLALPFSSGYDVRRIPDFRNSGIRTPTQFNFSTRLDSIVPEFQRTDQELIEQHGEDELDQDTLSPGTYIKREDGRTELRKVEIEKDKVPFRPAEDLVTTVPTSTLHNLSAGLSHVYSGSLRQSNQALSNSRLFANIYNLILTSDLLGKNVNLGSPAYIANTLAFARAGNTIGMARTSLNRSKQNDVLEHDNFYVLEASSEHEDSGAPAIKARGAAQGASYSRSIDVTGSVARLRLPLIMTPKIALSNPTILALSSSFPMQLKIPTSNQKRSSRGIVNSNQYRNNSTTESIEPKFGLEYYEDESNQGSAMGPSVHSDGHFTVSDGDQFEDEDENEEMEIRKLRKRIEKIISDELRRYGFQL